MNKLDIRTVSVVGANGTMGCNVSAIFASFGNAKVYLISRDIEKSEKAIEKAVASVRADSIRKNLIPADYSMLETCVSESDLIFESLKEELNVKLDITKKIANSLNDHAIACSGTSGLSITTLSECFQERQRAHFFGVHMFNPPYSMTLCEVTPTKYSDMDLFEGLKRYLKEKLFRTVVEVKDSPAFLGNRIGFQFINEALQCAEKYKDNGGIDYIDAILGSYTGRSMAPLRTSNFVGLDVHKAIIDNLYNNTFDYAHETFIMPVYALALVKEGKLGEKTGCGLYKQVKNDNGIKRMTVYDINTGIYRDRINYVFPYAEEMLKNLRIGEYERAMKALICNHSQEAEICLKFLLKYIIYSLSTAETVGYNIHSADDVMAAGFNWCPPLALIQALETISDIKGLVRERLSKDIVDSVDVDNLFGKIETSKYDFRLYFKAKR
jgi:3-hydroxyacyl-CoA dehydrogenase